MEIIVTAVGPDNVRLADPIIHHVTQRGANIGEIQMYNHDEEALFAMLLRISLPADELESLRSELLKIGEQTKLSVRVWSPDERASRPRLAICVTYRPEPALLTLHPSRPASARASALERLHEKSFLIASWLTLG